MSSKSDINLVLLAKSVEWQYTLNEYTATQLDFIGTTLAKAQKDLVKKINKTKNTSEWTRARTYSLLQEVEDLMLGHAQTLGKDIGKSASEIGEASYSAHSSILSFGGAATNVETVAVTAAQLKAMVDTVPIGGKTLNEWVKKTFNSNIQEQIKKEVAAGILNGERFADVSKRLKAVVPGTKQEIETLARTYMQSVNVQAMNDVYEANKDVIEKVKWRAAMGGKTCLRCAGLDGTEFKIGESPDIPLHPLCRCCLIPITKGKESLGLTQADVDKAARPYSVHDGRLKGLSSKVDNAGSFAGTFPEWYESLTTTQQKAFVGPGRHELISSGKITFREMIDQKTGRLKTLKELTDGPASKETIVDWVTSKTKRIDVSKLSPKYEDFFSGKHEIAGVKKKGNTVDDRWMKAMNKASGADALPAVVTKAKMDKLISEGAEEMFRGVSDPKMAEQFKTGSLFAGKGIYGNGTYTAYGSDGLPEASNYASLARNSGGLMRMTLKRDAKIVTPGELKDGYYKMAEKIEAESSARTKKIMDALKNVEITENVAEAKLGKIEKANFAMERYYSDIGRYALSQGYDAINITKTEYLIVLNRGAVIVQKEAIKANGDVL
jgi:SPP1 gp7 family putative phage head morphogenesis protein